MDCATLHVTEAPLEWLKSCVVPNDSNEGDVRTNTLCHETGES